MDIIFRKRRTKKEKLSVLTHHKEILKNINNTCTVCILICYNFHHNQMSRFLGEHQILFSETGEQRDFFREQGNNFTQIITYCILPVSLTGGWGGIFSGNREINLIVGIRERTDPWIYFGGEQGYSFSRGKNWPTCTRGARFFKKCSIKKKRLLKLRMKEVKQS